MSLIASRYLTAESALRRAQQEPRWIRMILTIAALFLLAMLLVIPLLAVFAEA
jgi:ABC-type sulfate transport system permease subunit